MNAIRIRRTLDSDTLHLPELKPLVGKAVEIIVLEEPAAPEVRPGTGDWEAFRRAADALRDTYDYDAQCVQDECDRRQAQDRLR
jgi:hypothetical protein